MTLNGIKQNISLLKLAYVNYYKEATSQDIQALIKLWQIQFEKYDDETVLKAVNYQISTNKFPPTIADIKESIATLNGSLIIDEHNAWDKVLECAKDCHNEEKYNSLSDDIKAVITRNEIIDIGMSDISSIPYEKNRFLKDYKKHMLNKLKTNEVAMLSTSNILIGGKYD